ncbi:bifunctional glycosyltransferase/class I SAM-dependent methyltransferase [Anaerolineales bacterium HSG24]|nr:bifunctional glycosyltransferase/class I SAM-dependent methyltransferase [Anaerolineales bacterium HSG24]
MLHKKKIGVLVVAYNALSHLVSVLDRIPAQTWERIDEVAVFDDASKDATYELAKGYKIVNNLEKLKIYRNEHNLGYGGNQKKGFAYFAEKGFDVVVLLHGDGQYAPEMLADMYTPIIDNQADIVLGSRMMDEYGGALRGGMPFYKYIGNRILSVWENKILNMNLTEFHSGYRAYSISALQQVNLANCTDDFHFDTEIIIKLNHFNFRFLEVPIPTYYGDEICHVNGLTYAYDVYQTVKSYKDTVSGYRTDHTYQEFHTEDYPLKPYEYSSHTLVNNIIRGVDKQILDIGCGPGAVEALADAERNIFIGLDKVAPPDKDRFRQFIVHDLEKTLPLRPSQNKVFDYILLLDILEHLINSDQILRDVHNLATPETKIIISVPNVANIYVRLSLLFGQFEYANRGILDKTHVRFFTKASLKRWITNHGFEIEQELYSIIPLNEIIKQRESNIILKLANHLLYGLTNLFSGLLGYQLILVVRKK